MLFIDISETLSQTLSKLYSFENSLIIHYLLILRGKAFVFVLKTSPRQKAFISRHHDPFCKCNHNLETVFVIDV